ncbi:hypothetical protein [Cohnella caldifontis]|uniref:hypothetical protein n=1 Tax=Cohnella caldifontis TaxID=3027471 RepID=UPI0023EBD739|nr:hypothetical protein [Cohnella sp. YIM B05605]
MRIRLTPAKLIQALACVAAIVLTAACGANNGAGNAAGGTNGRTQAQGYSDDGFLGTTNSYPKIPGRHMTLNYVNDANMMRDAIRDVPGVAGSNITFNGAEAYVTVKIRPDWDPRRISTVERQTASVLRFNFPRYTIHVTSTR